MKEFTELLKNKNFLLRFTEFVVCIIGIVLQYRYGSLYLVWGMYGWAFVSGAFVVAYFFDDPNVWTEVILLVVYIVVMLVAATIHFGVRSVMAFIAVVLMVIDVIILLVEKRK